MSRTDYAVCTCTNGKHHVTQHVTHATPNRPPRVEIERLYPTGHVVDRVVTWTPWGSR